jgi:cell wall-associated NlpC family hydrolase
MNSVHKITIIFALLFGVMVAGVSNAEAAPTLRASAMASAKTQKGAKYVYGREGGYSRGYDCSGLIKWAYKQHGKTLPRTAQDQYNKSKHIAAKDRKPGDLIFIADGKNPKSIYHVGIFTGVRNGKGYMINANTGSYRGRKVVEAPVYEYTAGRPQEYYGEY